MAFLMSAIDVVAPSGVWQWFILNVFGFIGNYGWRIVVLVIFLKLILSPLDFYQRYKMRKNQRITEALKPQMDKLEKQYGADKQMLQRKQMELQRSSGFSYMSACLPLIITLVLFITFFTALRSVSSYMEFKQYVEMYDAYVTAYDETGFDYEKRATDGFVIGEDAVTVISQTDEEGKAAYEKIDEWLSELLGDEELLRSTLSSEEIKRLLDDDKVKVDIDTAVKELKRFNVEYDGSYLKYIEANKGIKRGDDPDNDDLHFTMSILMQVMAQDASYDVYVQNKPSFIWIKSIWIADVPWSNAVPTYSAFKSTVGNYLDFNKNPGKVYEDKQKMFEDMASDSYDIVTAKVRKDNSLNKNNGYLIMVIAVVGLSLLSQFISTRQQKNAGQMNGQGMGMMKVMMWMMPIMLGVFAITSSSAFTLYMVTNSIMTLLINLVTTLIVNLMDGGFKMRDTEVVKYGRQDPNDKINGKNKK